MSSNSEQGIRYINNILYTESEKEPHEVYRFRRTQMAMRWLGKEISTLDIEKDDFKQINEIRHRWLVNPDTLIQIDQFQGHDHAVFHQILEPWQLSLSCDRLDLIRCEEGQDKDRENDKVVGRLNQALISQTSKKLLGVYLRDLTLQSNQMPVMSQLMHLTSFGLSYMQLPKESINTISQLTSLHTLIIHNVSNFDDTTCDFLSSLQELKTLDLGDNEQFTGDGLSSLSMLTKLEWLNVNNCKHFSNEGLGHIAQSPSIRMLAISHCPEITESGIPQLDPLTSLRSLDWFQASRISNFSPIVNSLTQLCELHFGADQSMNGHLSHVSRITNLESLILFGDVRDTDVQSFAQLPQLKQLGLLTHQLTENCFQTLESMTLLQKLILPNEGMYPQSKKLAQLKEIRPDCEVILTNRNRTVTEMLLGTDRCIIQ